MGTKINFELQIDDMSFLDIDDIPESVRGYIDYNEFSKPNQKNFIQIENDPKGTKMMSLMFKSFEKPKWNEQVDKMHAVLNGNQVQVSYDEDKGIYIKNKDVVTLLSAKAKLKI